MASLGQLVSELVARVANGRTDDIEKYLEIYNTKIEENKSGLGSIKKCSSRIKLLSSKTQRGRIRQECNILKCFPGTKCTFSILQGFITKTSNITLLQRNKYSFQAKGSKKQEKNDIGQIVAVASRGERILYFGPNTNTNNIRNQNFRFFRMSEYEYD